MPKTLEKRAVLRIWPFSAVKNQVAAVIRRPPMVKNRKHDAIRRPADVIRQPHMVINQQHDVIRRVTDAISQSAEVISRLAEGIS